MPVPTLDPNTWIDRYADYLYHYTISRVNDVDLAKDLVQETFIAALQSQHNFKAKASEKTWLVAILKRKIIDQYRRQNSEKAKKQVRMHYTDASGKSTDWIAQSATDDLYAIPGADLENTELGLAIQDCITKLPEKQAKAFVMKTLQEYTTEDICKELSISASNLWVIIHRARLSLVGCLDKTWF